MKTSEIILGGAFCLGLALAYAVGHKRGLSAAPEYLAAKQLDDNRHAQFWEQMAALETPEEQVCEQIFDMVDELRAASAYMDPDRIE